MPQRHTIDRPWQEFKESLEIFGIKHLARHELPVDRAKLVFEFGHAAGQEAFYRCSGISQHFPVGGIARRFYSEDEGIRCLLVPLREAFWPLRAIIGAVD